MTELVLTTYDWVPESPRGHVRDIRVRWALEEACLPYRVVSTPFRERSAAHVAHQPFGQVPWLTDGDISTFESGAILLHLAERSEALMPAHRRRRSEGRAWLFAALNSVEAASLPWSILVLSGDRIETPGAEAAGPVSRGPAKRFCGGQAAAQSSPRALQGQRTRPRLRMSAGSRAFFSVCIKASSGGVRVIAR